MKTSHYGLRLLIESILLEGFKEDQRYLIEKYPNQAQKLNELLPKWISWLAARFGEKPTVEETHPFEDAIVTIKNFSDKDKSIGVKYTTNPQFKSAVDEIFPPGERSWQTPNDVTNMTVNEMEMIIGLSERKKQRIEVTKDDDNIEGDRVGKVGPWNLWMPTSRGRSCKIAGYDPITLEPKTTWCTARIAGSNLFYNYVGRPGEEITLFYVIKDDPARDNDWLSLGFVNGELKLDGQSGGVSVNRKNEGLNTSLLKSVLGNHRDEILAKLTEKNKQLGGVHPARQKIADAALSAKALNYLIRGLSEGEALDLVRLVIKEPKVVDEVWIELSKNSKTKIKEEVAKNPKAPPEILKTLAGYSDRGVRLWVAQNPNTPPEILKTLAGDSDRDIKIEVAGNPKTPPEILKTLAGDSDEVVKMVVARNPNAPPELREILKTLAGGSNVNDRRIMARDYGMPTEILEILAGDSDVDVRKAVAENYSTPPEILKTLAGDPDISVRKAIAQKRRTPPEILKTLAGDSDSGIRSAVALNSSTPPEILKTLAGDPAISVRKAVAGNSSTPPEILKTLVGDPAISVRLQVAYRPRTPPEILKTLAGDPAISVRIAVAGNSSTPPEILKTLAGDSERLVKNTANLALKKLEPKQNESRLRELIRLMI